MAKYTKKQALLGLRFWKKALNEAIAAESEEDQKKEAGAEGEETEDTGAEDIGAEETAGDDAFPPAGEDAEGPSDTDAKIQELEARIAELEAKLANSGEAETDSSETEDADDAASEDVGSEEDADDSDDEDSEEDDSNDEDDEDDEEDSDEEDDKEDLDESASRSAKYAPNTVGAVTELLGRFNPRSKLMIRLHPIKEECMVVNIDGKLMLNGPGVTYMEIAKGSPMVNEGKTKKKAAKKTAK